MRERKDLETRLDLEDWKHLRKYAGNNPWLTKCCEMNRKLEHHLQ